MLFSVLDSILSEKRVQFRDKVSFQIRGSLEEGYGLFSIVEPSELARAVSNLINNSVEALPGSGLVSIQLKADDEFNKITIQDNGRGIPPEVLSKLGARGVTHGKENTESGSGLGIYHAKEFAEKAGGHFQIESALGQGTSVTLALPKTKAPWWFLERLKIASNQTIVSLDDDQTIHQIWDGRIKSSVSSTTAIEFLSFSSSAPLEEWLGKNRDKKILFLVDYQFLQSDKNGLDVIEHLDIAKQSVLVTSRFDEPQVRERAKSLGVKILPKGLAPFVPFSIESPREKYAAVVIDDDNLIHDMWELAAKSMGHKIVCFTRPEGFFARAQEIDFSSPLFIDVNLADGVRGESVAEQAAALGFTEIALATGFPANTIQAPACVRRVVGKEPAFST